MSERHTLAPLRPKTARLIAAGLFVGTFALLFATQDMGFTRDESFYFGYSEQYQDWMVRAGTAADDEARAAVFGRDQTVRTWTGNFEHPPLMKALFGFSWRAFARKDRAVIGVKPNGQGVRFQIFANASEGFAEGAAIDLLAPLKQGQAPTDRARILAHGVVTKRSADRVDVDAELVDSADGASDDAADTTSKGAESAAPPAAHPAAYPAKDGHVGDDPDASTTPETAAARRVAELCRQTPRVPASPAELPITPCQAREDRTLAFLSESQAMRLPGMLSGALAVALTFLLGLELFNWLAGLFGALAFIFVPEHFFHAHMTCFDMPIVALQVFVLYAFWRALRDRRWALAAAVGWGLALLTKHNAFFLPFGLVVWWLWTGRDRFRLRRANAVTARPSRWRLTVQLPPVPLALLCMPVVALPMFFSYWPKLWYDPFRSVRDYFAFHLQHDHYMQYWFGEPLQVPPFRSTYVFEKTGLTYPEVLIFLFVVGLLFLAPPTRWPAWFRGVLRGAPVTDLERAGTFAFLNAMIPLAIFMVPGTPIFGGIKHWMTGAPFIGIIAGYGLSRLVTNLRFPAPAALAAVVLLLAHPVAASIENSWIGTAYYNSIFAGGLQGGADKRLMRMFWGYSTRQTLDWLNAHAPQNTRVYWQNTTWGSYDMYQREGMLRYDIRFADGLESAQIALIDAKQAFWELEVMTRRTFGVAGPEWMVLQEGVPYMLVYVRPGALDAVPPVPFGPGVPPPTVPGIVPRPPPHAPKPALPVPALPPGSAPSGPAVLPPLHLGLPLEPLAPPH